MCWSKEMKDLLPKEKPSDSNVEWFLHDLLLSFKFNNKSKYFQSLSHLKPYLNRQSYLLLTKIGEERTW